MTTTDALCGEPTVRGRPCALPADHAQPTIHHAPPAEGEFCYSHVSWLCQAGQGKCQRDVEAGAQ